MGTQIKLTPKDKSLVRTQATSSQTHYHHPEKGLLQMSYCLRFQSQGKGKRKGRRAREESKGGTGEKQSMKERERKVCDAVFCSDFVNQQVIRKSNIAQPYFVHASLLTNIIFYLKFCLILCVSPVVFLEGRKHLEFYFEMPHSQ